MPDNIAINHSRFGGSIPGNLFEVVTIFSPFPKVATASQPWYINTLIMQHNADRKLSYYYIT
jgi:hypothetical protein